MNAEHENRRPKTEDQRPLSIIAHRGASAHAPENTRAAFRRAIADGADGIELDGRLSSDSIPVVVHDATLRRLAKIERRVADLTAEELSAVDVGSWFNRAFPQKFDEKFAAETVPTLAEFFDLLGDYAGVIYVELKGASRIEPLVETIGDFVGKTNTRAQIVVKSFNLEAIKLVKQIAPHIRTAALFEPKILTVLRKKKRILEEAAGCDADEISLHRSLATKKFVRQARENNFSVVIWTADNPVWVSRAIDYGIGAIITNEPAKLLAERERVLRNTPNDSE